MHAAASTTYAACALVELKCSILPLNSTVRRFGPLSESWEQSPTLRCARCFLFIFSTRHVTPSRLIYETIAGRGAPVAICPQPTLSHSGFSHAPEKVTARPPPSPHALRLCEHNQRAPQTVIDLARLLACGLVRRRPSADASAPCIRKHHAQPPQPLTRAAGAILRGKRRASASGPARFWCACIQSPCCCCCCCCRRRRCCCCCCCCAALHPDSRRHAEPTHPWQMMPQAPCFPACKQHAAPLPLHRSPTAMARRSSGSTHCASISRRCFVRCALG